jgi:hypothetical protein
MKTLLNLIYYCFGTMMILYGIAFLSLVIYKEYYVKQM